MIKISTLLYHVNDCSSRKATIVTVAAEFCIVFLRKKKKKCNKMLQTTPV